MCATDPGAATNRSAPMRNTWDASQDRTCTSLKKKRAAQKHECTSGCTRSHFRPKKLNKIMCDGGAVSRMRTRLRFSRVSRCYPPCRSPQAPVPLTSPKCQLAKTSGLAGNGGVFPSWRMLMHIVIVAGQLVDQCFQFHHPVLTEFPWRQTIPIAECCRGGCSDTMLRSIPHQLG